MKKIIPIIFAVLLLPVLLSSCRKQDEFYREFYQTANEYRYPQPLSTFTASSGYYRVELSWKETVDPSLKYVKIFWNSGKDSVKVDLKKVQIQDGYAKYVIDNVNEGEQTFVGYTFNTYDKSSLSAEAPVNVRGDAFIETLAARTVKSYSRSGDEAQIVWNTRTRNLSYCEVKYPSTSGGTKTITVDPVDVTTVITDYDFASGSAFEYRSVYVLEGMIDTLYKPWTIGGVIE